MAPETFDLVVERRRTDRHKIRPAILHEYRRQAVRGAAYPAIVPCPSGKVLGTYITGLSDGDMHCLDRYESEGFLYKRRKVRVKLLKDLNITDKIPSGDLEKREGEEVETETYVWARSLSELENREWDFERFRRYEMKGFWETDDGFEDAAAARGEQQGGGAASGQGGTRGGSATSESSARSGSRPTSGGSTTTGGGMGPNPRRATSQQGATSGRAASSQRGVTGGAGAASQRGNVSRGDSPSGGGATNVRGAAGEKCVTSGLGATGQRVVAAEGVSSGQRRGIGAGGATGQRGLTSGGAASGGGAKDRGSPGVQRTAGFRGHGGEMSEELKGTMEAVYRHRKRDGRP
jgi:Gamma-glutamyl cyclotransferase, AIG2-like